MAHGISSQAARKNGRLGGRPRSSQAKQVAARKNGRLGGRPRKALALLARVRALYAELADKIPDIDPGDALLVIERMCRGPHDDRVFFIFPRPGGGYDF